MINLNKYVLVVLSMGSFFFPHTLLAQSTALPGKQCVSDLPVSGLMCINPAGSDDGLPDDVRLYVTEFQTCKEGNITELDKLVTGHIFSEEGDVDSQVVFSGVRTHMDDRVNNLTLELPKSAVIKNKSSIFVLNITNQVEADYEGADIKVDWHFKGSFKKMDSKGRIIRTGRLYCLISRLQH